LSFLKTLVADTCQLYGSPNKQNFITGIYKKAQLSLTNPRDAKACQNCSNSTCL